MSYLSPYIIRLYSNAVAWRHKHSFIIPAYWNYRLNPHVGCYEADHLVWTFTMVGAPLTRSERNGKQMNVLNTKEITSAQQKLGLAATLYKECETSNYPCEHKHRLSVVIYILNT